MARYQIEWSAEARLDLFDLLNFYLERNGNAVYSRKLNAEIRKSVKIISKNPFTGIKTSNESAFIIFTGNYQIIYKVIDLTIVIVMIWDSRRNPENKTTLNHGSLNLT